MLASLQLRNIVARCLVCLYLFADIICTIIREGSCMSFLPLSTYHTTLQEATLRLVFFSEKIEPFFSNRIFFRDLGHGLLSMV